jgi:peptidoglycan/xylan/chitin deacetylase (PgdA/CDA1 family)
MADIAVVIPCFNLGRMVEEAVDSVLAQTRPAAEIVVVDDGSTDLYTRQVLARLGRPRVRVVRTPNRGLPAARNHGIRLTSGRYLVTLDADDVLDPTYLEKTAARLDAEHGVGFVSTAIRAFGAATYTWTPPACNLVNALTTGSAHPASMFRRRLWEAVGGVDESPLLHGCEDLDFWISAMELGFHGEVLAEPLLHYRVRRDSMHHGAVTGGTYVGALEAVLRKHRRTLEALGVEVLVAKERFLRERDAQRRMLEHRRVELTRELASVEREIEAARRALRESGREDVAWGDLRRLTPLSQVWGLDRGRPFDRHYIEGFLERHRSDIRGRVLEVKDSGYTERFGGAQVTERDAVDVDASNPAATIVADLTRGDGIEADRFDCFVLTQTLHIIYDVRAALATAYRILAPGGVLLCTLPAVSRINYEDGGLDGGDYWRFTEASLRRLFAEVFPLESFEITGFGNVMACAAFLYGLSPDEVDRADLDHLDPAFPLLFGVRAVKPLAADSARDRSRAPVHGSRADAHGAGAILLYHRVAALTPDVHRLCVTPANFRAHMAHLREHYVPISLEELAEGARRGRLPDDAVAVTLDDGCLDNLDAASEILLDLGVPATFFVTTERLGEAREFWWDTLERLLLTGAPVPPHLGLDLAGGRRTFPTATDGDRRSTHDELHRAIVRLGVDDRDAVMETLRRWSGLDLAPRPSHRPMLPEEIVRLAARPGHSIGAHTTHHLYLPAQPLDVQRQEVEASKRALEGLLRQPVRTFGYPYGGYSAEAAATVRRAGFLAAVTVDEGLVRPGIDPVLLPRCEIKDWDGSRFGAHLRAFLRRPVTRR